MAKKLNGHAEEPERATITSDPRPDGRMDADSRSAAEDAACTSKADAAAPAAELPADPKDDGMRPRSAFRPGNAPPRTVVEWVASNLSVQPIEPGEAPDSTAWGLLRWARSSAASASAFYQMWAKLLPSRAQVDEQDTSDEDGGELIDTLEFVYNAKRTAALRVGAEELAGEPPLSRGDTPRDDGEPA